jgi:hypothetical protein
MVMMMMLLPARQVFLVSSAFRFGEELDPAAAASLVMIMIMIMIMMMMMMILRARQVFLVSSAFRFGEELDPAAAASLEPAIFTLPASHLCFEKVRRL